MVELQDPGSGQPLDGFAFCQSDPIQGNTLSAAGSWGVGNATRVGFRGKLVTVAVAMTDSDLFSIQFGQLEP